MLTGAAPSPLASHQAPSTPKSQEVERAREEASNQVGEAGSIQDTLAEARGPTDAREEAGSEESGSTEAAVTRSARGRPQRRPLSIPPNPTEG